MNMRATKIECPDCNGEGFVRVNQWPYGPTCPFCSGAGWREMTQDEADDAAADAFSDMCEGEPPVGLIERHWQDARRLSQMGVR